MTNMKSTKKALITSALCLLLCVSMLVGATFAWFTDSVSTTNNVITAGNLDVNLYWSTDGNAWTPVDANTNIFKTGTLWEPGHTEVVYLKVVNEGTLALKYDLQVNVASEVKGTNVAGEEFKLSDYILYNVTNGVTTFANSAEARGSERGNKLNNPYGKASTLEAGQAVELTMVVFMPTTVGNEANYLKDTAIPTINLGINLFATQYTYENDSYGPDYDADAPYTVVANVEELKAAVAEGGYIMLEEDVDLSEILVIEKDGTVINGNGKTLTSTAGRAINVSGADGVKIENLTIQASGERAINVINGATNVTVENVTATASNYTVNVAGSGANAVVTIKNSNLTGLNVVNIAGAGANVTIDNTTITTIDNSSVEGYSSICLNKDAVNGRIVATNTTVNLNGSYAEDSSKARNGADGGYVSLNGSTDDVRIDVAYISYGDYYYGFPSIEAAFAKVADGETIGLIRDITGDIVIPQNDLAITIDGNGHEINGCINLNGSSNKTLKNIVFNAAGAKYSYNAKGQAIQPANIISRSSGSNVAGAANIVIENCVFGGTLADGGVVIAFTDQGTTGYSNITIKGCKFDVTGGYADIYTYYSGNNGSFVIENNTFSSKYYMETSTMLPIYLGKYQSSTPVVVKNNDFQNKTSFNAAAFLQDHSNYRVSFGDTTGNTFAN